MQKKITELKLNELKDVAGGVIVAYATMSTSTTWKAPTYSSPLLSTSLR